MKILVAGTVRVPAENIERMRPHMAQMLAATRAEDGCLTYSYAWDVQEPGLLRIFEAWRDAGALAAHFQTPHMAAWRSALPDLGVGDRQLTRYEVTAEEGV